MGCEVSVKKIKRSCKDVCLILRALSHPQRLLIMGHLLSGEKTVTHLVEQCGISQSQMSQFLSRMKGEGLIACRREGRFQFYSVADLRLRNLMQAIQTEYCN